MKVFFRAVSRLSTDQFATFFRVDKVRGKTFIMVRNKRTALKPFDASIYPAGALSNSENASTPASSSAPLPIGRTDDSLNNSKPPDRKPDTIDTWRRSSNSTIPQNNANNNGSPHRLQPKEEVSNSGGRSLMTYDSNRTVTDNKHRESSCGGSSNLRSPSKDTKKSKDDNVKTSQKLTTDFYTKNTIQVGKAIFESVKGDLFHAHDDFSLAHCVGEDMAMGAGIAVRFREMFRNVGSLLDQQVKTGGVAILPLPKRFVYYLVTKTVSTQKPTMLSLKSSLEKMKEHIIEYRVTKLAIPEIGSGLDWDLVEGFLMKLFSDVSIHIQIYHYVPDNPTPAFECSNKVIYKNMDLVRVVDGTALIYIGSVTDKITNSMISLHRKYDFIREYLNTKRELGDVVRIESIPDNTYGFICVGKDGRFSYEMFDQCMAKFHYLNMCDSYLYVGISSIKSPNDEQLMLKIENLVKYRSKLGIELWICNPVSYTSDLF